MSDYQSLMQREDRKRRVLKDRIGRLQDFLIERPREELVRWEQEDRIRTESLRALENTRFLSSRINLMHEAAVWCDQHPDDYDQYSGQTEMTKKKRYKMKRSKVGGISRQQSSSAESLPLASNVQEQWTIELKDLLASSDTTLERLTQFVFFKITSGGMPIAETVAPDPHHEPIWKKLKKEHPHGAFLILLTYVLPTVQQFLQSVSFAVTVRSFLNEQVLQLRSLLDEEGFLSDEERPEFEAFVKTIQALLENTSEQETRLNQLLEQLSRYQIVIGQWAIKLVA